MTEKAAGWARLTLRRYYKANNVSLEENIDKEGIDDMAKKIGDLPGVSKAFKKCMKGRFGCGGSSFPKLRVTCEDSTDCGPCGSGAGGCNIFTSTLWYCQAPTVTLCDCIETIFHEAAHSCGIIHSAQYYLNPNCAIANERACEIGQWFYDEFQIENDGCIDSLGGRSGTIGGSNAD